jgi:DNA-binding transcriptional ArsR family regulator
MKLKILIKEVQKQHPDWGYKRIAEELGYDQSSVRYHLNSAYRARHTLKRYERRRQLKRQLVKQLGGKCSRCGYQKCMRALEFHHSDPSEKEAVFNQYRDSSLLKIQKEISKCILVCSNCHAEIHEEQEKNLPCVST